MPDHGFNVLGTDDTGAVRPIRYRQRIHFAELGCIQENPATDIGAGPNLLDPKIAHSQNVADGVALVDRLTVALAIHEIALGRVHADVAGTIKLCADLPDLGSYELIVKDCRRGRL